MSDPENKLSWNENSNKFADSKYKYLRHIGGWQHNQQNLLRIELSSRGRESPGHGVILKLSWGTPLF